MTRMYLTTLLIAAASAIFAVAPVAHAAPALSKTRAVAKTLTVTKTQCSDLSGCKAVSVVGPSKCRRRGVRTVDCRRAMWTTEGDRCEDTVRVRLKARARARTVVAYLSPVPCHVKIEADAVGDDGASTSSAFATDRV